ncbi:unnamed protein product [Rotaria magnacalcarata]|nr:unnamed protein product [Rotaria magnacalcarata]CAF4095622.1 unnamed protein product [Rotaria magnacalcarata]CAF4113960.1 unnamed protein product [Rotaria magnacalcarata]CAF4293034.1 unnamed protein product [Rotaria magnacalcarata]
MLLTTPTLLSAKRHDRRLFFSNHKTTTVATTPDEPSYGNMFSNWLSGFLSKDPNNNDKHSSSLGKLALLKSFLSSSSSSTGNDSKLDKIFEFLSASANDGQNKASSSTSKLNGLLQFFGGQGSTSNNLQLAVKLMNIAQGKGGLSSLNSSDLKALSGFVSG